MTDSVAVSIGVLFGIVIVAASFGYIWYVDRPRRKGSQGSAQDQTAHHSRTLATEQFEALTHCPGCGTYGPHLMREPRRMEWTDIEARRQFYEGEYATIRVCECGTRWGQN